MKTVLEGLIGNQTIAKLTISGHGGDDEPPPTLLGESLCRVLAKVLRKSTSIKELALVDEAIDWDEGLVLICDGLRKNQSIKSLDLLDGYFFRTMFVQNITGSPLQCALNFARRLEIMRRFVSRFAVE